MNLVTDIIEYSCELLNSNINLEFVSSCTLLLVKEIATKVFEKIRENSLKVNEVRMHNENILNNPRLSQLLANETIYTRFEVKLKELPMIKKQIIYQLKPISHWKSRFSSGSHHYGFNYEKSYEEVIKQTIINLKKKFIDATIYSENKEIRDVHDQITIHQVIVVNWEVPDVSKQVESPMMRRLKATNPGVIYPSNMGQKWTDEEENTLLEELECNTPIDTIAKTHKRTTGGINARRRQIAYNMHLKKAPIESIMQVTKLERDLLMEMIDRRQQKANSNEMNEIKNNINELRHEVNELVEMLNAIYTFENV